MESMVTIFDQFKRLRPVTKEDVEDVRTIMWRIGDPDKQNPTWRMMLKNSLSRNEVEAIWQEYTNEAAKIVANKRLERTGVPHAAQP